MSKTKEEIFNQVMDGHTVSMLSVSDVFKMMDEYAKQQAIAFDDWTAFNHVKYQKGGTWVCAGKVYEQPPTTEQLYNQFESLNK